MDIRDAEEKAQLARIAQLKAEEAAAITAAKDAASGITAPPPPPPPSSGGMLTANHNKSVDKFQPFSFKTVMDAFQVDRLFLELILKMQSLELPVHKCTEALLRSMQHHEGYMMVQLAKNSISVKDDASAAEQYRASIQKARAIAHAASTEAILISDSSFLSTFRLRPGQNIASAILQLSNWRLLMENCYSADELRRYKIYPTGDFETDAAKQLSDAIKVAGRSDMQSVLREIRQSDKSWADWKGQFIQDAVQNGEPAQSKVTPARTLRFADTAAEPAADDGEDAPIYAMDSGRKSISDETTAKVTAVLQQPLEKITELMLKLEEHARANGEANREVAKGILVLRECLTIVRDNKNVDWNGSAGSIQAALTSNATAASQSRSSVDSRSSGARRLFGSSLQIPLLQTMPTRRLVTRTVIH